jgi:hypothetical protein
MALAVLPISAIVHAQLNCMIRQCIEIPFKDNGENMGKNVLCLRTKVENGIHKGLAYAAPTAHLDCYGQNSVGGNIVTRVINTHARDVVCRPDCDGIPDNTKCSGVVEEYLSGPMPINAGEKCTIGVDPPPDPEPDPDPDPDPDP